MKHLLIYLCCITLTGVFGCKNEKPSAPKKASRPKTEDPSTEDAKKSPQEQIIDNELGEIQSRIDEYKQAPEYSDPDNSEFNTMVDAVDNLTTEDVSGMIDDGEFSNIEDNIKAIDDGLSSLAESEAGSGSNEKSDSLRNTGYFLVGLAALGVAVSAGARQALEAKYGRYIRDDLSPEKKKASLEALRTQTGFNPKRANLATAGVSLTLLTLGAILISQDQPSGAMVAAAQFSMYIIAGMSLVSAAAFLYFGKAGPDMKVSAAQQIKALKALEAIDKDAKIYSVEDGKYTEVDPRKQVIDPSKQVIIEEPDTKLAAADSSGARTLRSGVDEPILLKDSPNFSDKKLTDAIDAKGNKLFTSGNIRGVSFVGGFLAATVGIYTAYRASNKMELADGTMVSPENNLMVAVETAMRRFAQWERAKANAAKK